MITTVTRQQFLTALSNRPLNFLLLEDDTSFLLMEDDTSRIMTEEQDYWYFDISMDTNQPDWIELYSAKLINVGDPLYVKVQIALGYTSAQMLDLFNAAVQVPR
jgi:hypothetical protein